MNQAHAVTLTETLRSRAERTPDAVGYEECAPSGRPVTLTYAQLAGRASALARQLRAAGDGPVLLLYPAGLNYVVGVLAAFLAGRPLVPAYPPGRSGGADRSRLRGLVTDLGPGTAVAPEPFAGWPTLAVPGAEEDGGPWWAYAVPGEVAVVQYTSGSTGDPHGVLVSPASLAANTAVIVDRFELGPTSRVLSWLPPYHDMGLVGGLLTPLVAGIPVRLLAPEEFLKAPLGWLQEISRSGTTVSGGPDFAYRLCVRRAARGELPAGLDLSGWRVAFNGAETVRRATMEAFSDRFGPVGFDRRAFLPCYGLAEATLLVSAGRWSGTGTGPVSCGAPVPGQQVVVVDPSAAVACPDGTEGEIWISGPQVTAGYWSGAADKLFGTLAGRRFLRTGDLGYRADDELFVTGRSKDVLVHHGVNHHAGDLEDAAVEVLGPDAGAAAAFLVETDRAATPVLVLELRGDRDAALAVRVRSAVLERTGLRLGVVVLVGPHSIPRTSSGKVRRSACRDAFLAGCYADGVLDGQGEDRPTASAVTEDLTSLACGVLAEVCGLPDCRPTDRLSELGVDSVRAAEAAAVLEDALGLHVPLEAMLTAATPSTITDALLRGWQVAGVLPDVVHARVESVLTAARG